MCGVIGIYEIAGKTAEYRQRALHMASLIRHRGPDGSGIYSDENVILAHERLAIVDPEHGTQPLIDSETGCVLIANGEIYNHVELRQKLKQEHAWKTKSDCEVILYLYDEFGAGFIDYLSGIFAFVLYDPRDGALLIARDHVGICPLYWGWDEQGIMHISSELKALDPYCPKIEEFPPGSYYSQKQYCHGELVQWYRPSWAEFVPRKPASLVGLRKALEAAVEQQLMADVPYGVLLSGGLDSSLVAAIASKIHRERDLPPLHSFAIGLEDSPDLVKARIVAEQLGTIHHEIIFTIQEALDTLQEVIYHIETFDVTTIRASTPMFLLARKIKSIGIKMVLSGEGSDEIFGGYLYFHMAPDAIEFHQETVRKLSLLSKYDCLRANKSLAAWGVEVRVPFLDKEFLDYAMSIDPEYKVCPEKKIEKKILREAFAGLLPQEILWRQKEQFSDGVGYAWIDHLRQRAEGLVTDIMLASAKDRFPQQTPLSKEEYSYREIFDRFFHSPSAALTVPVGPSIACSTPTALRWSKEFQGRADPSGRSVRVHERSQEGVMVSA